MFLLVTLFWAYDPIAIKLGTPKTGYGVSQQVQLETVGGFTIRNHPDLAFCARFMLGVLGAAFLSEGLLAWLIPPRL